MCAAQSSKGQHEPLWLRQRGEGQGAALGSASATTSFDTPGDLLQHTAGDSFYNLSVNLPAAHIVHLSTGTCWTSMGGAPNAAEMEYMASLQTSDSGGIVGMDQHGGGPNARLAAVDAGRNMGGSTGRRHRCSLCICRLWRALFLYRN